MADSDNESAGLNSGGESSLREQESLREQDRLLPIANVSRIMKKALPPNAKMSKDAKETVQECVSEFISFITGEASDKCQREKRKTINGDDLIWAMTALGFEDYVEPLKVYLQKYRDVEGEKSFMGRQGQGDHHQQQQQQQKDGPSSSGTLVNFGNSESGFAGGGDLFGGSRSTVVMMGQHHHHRRRHGHHG